MCEIRALYEHLKSIRRDEAASARTRAVYALPGESPSKE